MLDIYIHHLYVSGSQEKARGENALNYRAEAESGFELRSLCLKAQVLLHLKGSNQNAPTGQAGMVNGCSCLTRQ